MSTPRTFDDDLFFVLGTIGLAITIFFLVFINKPDFQTVQVFGWVATFFGGFIVMLELFKKTPYPVAGNFHFKEAFPWTLLGVLGIYVLSRFVGLLLPQLFEVKVSDLVGSLFRVPDFGAGWNAVFNEGLPLLSLESDLVGLKGVFEIAAWQLVVATSEEVFKLGLIMLIVIPLIAWGVHRKLGITASQLFLYVAVVFITVWALLHSLQNYSDLGSLIIAGLSGGILFGLYYKFKNVIAAIAGHAEWNLFASTAPGFCIIRGDSCAPPTLGVLNIHLTGALEPLNQTDPYIILFTVIGIAAWYMLKHQGDVLANFSLRKIFSLS